MMGALSWNCGPGCLGDNAAASSNAMLLPCGVLMKLEDAPQKSLLLQQHPSQSWDM